MDKVVDSHQENSDEKGVLSRFLGMFSSDSHKKIIQDTIDALKNELDKPLKVAVIGGSRVGKSTLINSIFGTNLKTSSGSKGCTTEFEWITSEETIHVLDCPGIGDGNTDQNEEYKKGYKEHLPQADLIIVVRAVETDYESTRRSIDLIPKGLQYIVVITKVDQLNEFEHISDDWELDPFQPKDSIKPKFEEERKVCSESLNIPLRNILAVASRTKISPHRHWGHTEVVEVLIENAQNAIVKGRTAKKAKEENVSEKAKANAERGVIDWVMDKVGDVVEAVGDFAVKATITKIISWFLK